MQQLSASCTTKLCQIDRVKHVFNQVTLLIIINVLVMSKIDYCSVIWSSTSESNIKRIQLLQLLLLILSAIHCSTSGNDSRKVWGSLFLSSHEWEEPIPVSAVQYSAQQ